jgi:hypothetical protein
MAIGILKETSKAVMSMTVSLLLFPAVPIIMQLLFVLYWGASLAYVYTTTEETLISSAGNATDGLVQLTPEHDPITKAVWAYVFWYFWTVEVIAAFATMCTAGAIGHWYWAGGRADGDRTNLGGFFNGPVAKSIGIVLRYHLGTVVCGALLVAIVRFLRAVLTYIQKKTAGTESRMVKALLWVMQCCLWCLQKILVFINKNAYIITAVKGTPFVSSARCAFSLLVANIVRVGTVSYVSYFILLLGRLLVAFVCLIVAYFWIGHHVNDDNTGVGVVHYETFWVYVLVFCISYIIAYVMIAAYDMAVDTMLLCLLMDEDANKDQSGVYYAPTSLVRFLEAQEKHAFAWDKNAAAHQQHRSPNNMNGKAKAKAAGAGVDFTGTAGNDLSSPLTEHKKQVGEV